MGKRVGTAKWMEKQNRWQIKVQKDGERRTFTSSKPGRNGQREANAKADAWLDEGIENANKRVSALLDEYIADLKARTSKSHWRVVEGRVNLWICPVIGNIKMSNLNDQHMQKVINNAYQKGNLSKKSLENLRTDLNAFAKFCRKCKASTFYPEEITIPASAKRKTKHILQPESLKKLFASDNTLFKGSIIFEPFIYAYRFQVLTGLRPGELLGLRKEDILPDRINITRSINIYGEETQGKNSNAIRTIRLGKVSRQVLEQQLKISNSDSVFEIPNQQTYLKHWKRYCDFNGIPYVTPYELRHTFVSIAQNLPEGQLKKIVGHSASMDTYGVYAHEVQGESEKTAEALDNIFSCILSDEAKK